MRRTIFRYGIAMFAGLGMAVLPATMASAATTLYVDQGNASCSDSGSGTSATPFCTISAAAAKAGPGTTVQVAAGTYNEMVTVTKAGTASAPVVFTAAPGVTVSGGGSRANGFKISSKAYVTVRGFAVTQTTGVGILVSSSNHVTLDSNSVTLAGQRVSGLTAKGISLSGVTASTVTNNKTFNNSDAGIGVTSSSNGNTISGNESYANARGYTRAAAGIDLRNSTGNTVIANRLHDNEDSGLNIWSGSSSTVATDNVIWANGDHGIDVHSTNDAVVVSNTVYKNTDSGIEMTGSLRTYLQNNISADNGINSPRTSGQVRADATSAPATTLDYDDLFLSVTPGGKTVYIDWGGTKYTTLAAFQKATGQETNGISADPKFVSPPGDLHLASGSPAINSGNNAATGEPSTDADGGARINNGTIDRGAFESSF